MILAARVTTSVPHVRAQIARLHDRDWQPRLVTVTDLVALAIAAAAVALDGRIVVGAAVLAVIAAFQRFRRRRPVAPVKVIGIGQMVLGLALVVASAVGVAAL